MRIVANSTFMHKTSKEVTKDVTAWCNMFHEFVLSHSCMSLTATQVGRDFRIIAVKNRSRKKAYVMVNPKECYRCKKTYESTERILHNGPAGTVTKQRPYVVRIEYSTPDLSKTKHKTFYYRQAAAALHALDILDGKLK